MIVVRSLTPQQATGNALAGAFSIDPKESIRTHICSGSVYYDDIIQALHDIYTDEGFSHSLHLLWDFRHCTAKISRAEIENIIDFVRKFRSGPGGGKTALVVGGESDYGLARMYEMLTEYDLQRKLTVFKEYDSDLEWIRQ